MARTYAQGTHYRVAFIGLGNMGFPMAGHLARAGHRVCVYNRTPAKAQAWCQAYPGESAPSPREAAQDCDFVFTCVGNDDDLVSVLTGENGAFAGMKKDAVLIDCTTASADVARKMYEFARSRNLYFMDAPVSGGQSGAENGNLTVMCGATQALFDRARPVIDCFAQAVTRIGEVGAGQLAKMCNQICIAGIVQSLSEAVAFGENAGLDMSLVLNVIDKGAAQSWQMQNRGQTMLDNQFDFGFAIDWMRKDFSLCLNEAKANGSSLPLVALVDQFYGELQQRGDNRLDTSCLIKRLPRKN